MKQIFWRQLRKRGFEAESIQTTQLSIGSTLSGEASKPQAETGRLYQLAKLFIRAVQMQ